MSPAFTEDDIGKPVETDAGDRLAVVVEVDPETAYVEPTPDAADSTRAVLEWEGSAAEAVPVTDDVVDVVTDDAIRLEADFDEEALTTGTTAEGDRSEEPATEGAAGTEGGEVDYAPGEPVASNPTETATGVGRSDTESGTAAEPGTDGLEDEEPMMEDRGFYDAAEGDARVDPDEEMEPPDETESGAEAVATGEADEEEIDERDASESDGSSDRSDVDVDPDEVTDGEPEAEIDSEEDVGRRRDPGDSTE